jgi:hypothetical protein
LPVAAIDIGRSHSAQCVVISSATNPNARLLALAMINI